MMTRSMAGLWLLTGLLAGCGSSKNSESKDAAIDGVARDAPTAGTLTGVAAQGSPITGATVTVAGASGGSATAATTTDVNGNYTVDTTGLTPPFLVKVSGGTATATLFSVAPVVNSTANVTPYSNLLVSLYYQAQSSTTAAAFASLSGGTSVSVPAGTDAAL